MDLMVIKGGGFILIYRFGGRMYPRRFSPGGRILLGESRRGEGGGNRLSQGKAYRALSERARIAAEVLELLHLLGGFEVKDAA